MTGGAPTKVSCPVSVGELVDKISILEIKRRRIDDEGKLAHVRLELDSLRAALDSLRLEGVDAFLERLTAINGELWDIEDAIRRKERERSFDQGFIDLARRVYLTNDRRFDVKDAVNRRYGSAVRETKSYESYRTEGRDARADP